jgi:TolA-binding protein
VAIVQLDPFNQWRTRMTKTSTLILSGLLAAFTVSGFAQTAAAPAVAASGAQWKKDHPRRAEVNARLKNQNQRINDKVEDGKMSKAKAAKLHKEDRQIRQEERDMAAQNGGHITKQEQAVLNKQENKVSNQIGK